MTGAVSPELEPVIHLSIRNQSGRERTLPIVVDTGFDGYLTLPPKIIEDLELTWVKLKRSILADGSEVEHDVYNAEVVWDGKPQILEIDEADTTPLVGTTLLSGYELKAQFRPHGKVTIKKMPPKRKSKK